MPTFSKVPFVSSVRIFFLKDEADNELESFREVNVKSPSGHVTFTFGRPLRPDFRICGTGGFG